MIEYIEAIYSDGVFEPITTVELPENQRVRIVVEHVEKLNVAEWLKAVNEFHRELESKYGLFPDSTEIIRTDRRRDG